MKGFADQETLLELGLVAFAAALAAGVGIRLCGRTSGGVRHGAGRAAGPPARGSVPAHRHQNVGSVSAR